MRVVVDTGPLVAAANKRDRAHRISAALVSRIGAELIVPDPVLVEADQLLRSRVGPEPARHLLAAVASGVHELGVMTRGLLRRAAAIDRAHAGLGLGYADAAVMALAERRGLPILTYDFPHFRAVTPQEGGYWRLVIDENRLRESTD